MQPNTSGSTRRAPARRLAGRLPKLGLSLVSIVLGLLLCAAPVRLTANPVPETSTQIYLYTSSGLVNVTSSTYYVDGHTYITYNGSTIEALLDHEEGHVYGLNGEKIGVLMTDPDA